MIIEIRRAGFVNKGGELMLHAVVQKLRERYPEATLTMAPVFGGTNDTFYKMRELELQPKAWVWKYGIDFGNITHIIPQRLLNLYGLTSTKDVDVVIDAAGFAYSDQWGVSPCQELSSSSKKWCRGGKKSILLPQALGPFENKKNKKYVAEFVKNIDLIFPRELDSYHNLINISGPLDKIKVFPDFTNLVEGTLPQGYEPVSNQVALIPNYRMIDMTTNEESDAYTSFMIRCAEYLIKSGKRPFILVHDTGKDQLIAENISKSVGNIPIINEPNPLHIKGIIGSCDATIGSRFHGLVSALSQGVPSLATGWSHKYERLFEDYDFKDGIVKVLDSDELLFKKIDMITSPDLSEPIRNNLLNKSNYLKGLSEEMWQLVFDEIDGIT